MVVLPAPLGPKYANRSPGNRRNDIPSKAVCEFEPRRKLFLRSVTVMASVGGEIKKSLETGVRGMGSGRQS